MTARCSPRGRIRIRSNAASASERGHLSNEQAAEELASLLHDGLTAVVAMHVSENNNDYELPGKALREALVREGHGAAVHVARQRSLVSI